jgi:hypothetical protein
VQYAVGSSQVALSHLCWSEREVSLLHPMAAGYNAKTLTDVGTICIMVASAVPCMLFCNANGARHCCCVLGR